MTNPKIDGQKLDKKIEVKISDRFTELLEQDTGLKDLFIPIQQLKDEEQAKQLLTYLKDKGHVLSQDDLRTVFGRNGEYLDQLLSQTGYQPLQYSTGEDLDQAIESTSFIAEKWLPRGYVTALVSSPGLGKSYLALEVAKILTTEQTIWFDGATSVQAGSHFVIWCEAEGFHGGLKDRIKQLKIPPQRIILPFEDPLEDFRLNLHFAQLQDVVDYHESDLVVIDTLRASHGREEKDSKDMQAVMSKLVTLAKNFNVAVIINHHTNKPAFGKSDLVDINRVRGSGAIAANCRMIWGLEQPNPENKVIRFKVVKSNLCAFPKPLVLVIGEEGIKWEEGIGWEDVPVSLEGFDQETKLDQAVAWLEEYLKNGPKPAEEVKAEGEKAGHRPSTLRRASERPGFITKLAPDKHHKHWRWQLDAHSSQSNNDDHLEHV